jgi:hypothetical protein
MKWLWDSDLDALTAPSQVFHDDGQPLLYVVECDGDEWKASFEGVLLHRGSLEGCLATCKAEDEEPPLRADEVGGLTCERCGKAFDGFIGDTHCAACDKYGKCPICGAFAVSRERRPNGMDKCARGHVYPSREAVSE